MTAAVTIFCAEVAAMSLLVTHLDYDGILLYSQGTLISKIALKAEKYVEFIAQFKMESKICLSPFITVHIFHNKADLCLSLVVV